MIIHNYTGKSIKELLKKYGTSSSGFYPQDWYKTEKFFTEKPPKGKYEIDLGENLTNLTYDDQLKKLSDGFTPIHPAILIEYILSYYKETGQRLLEDTFVRTESVVSDGYRVCVGDFGSWGLDVGSDLDGSCDDDLGLSSARKFDKKIDALNLESSESKGLVERVKELEKFKAKVEKVLKI